MTNEKNKIEALLFTVGKRIHIDEISKITGIRNTSKINDSLNELKNEYEAKGSSMVLHDEGEGNWKLTVKDHYLPMVRKVVNQTELDKPLMETLAVVAWKYPILQADVIKIRHNKAYGHLKELEEMGFISRTKYGRTNKITLTQKFFNYFDLPSKQDAKEVFKNVMSEKEQNKLEETEKEIVEAEKKIEEAERKKKEKKEKEKESPDPHKPPVPDPTQLEGENNEDKPCPKKPPVPDPVQLKKEIDEIQKEEDNELEDIEKDIEDIEKEEEKESYSN
ncbi:hypothetical protein GF361_01645 [Candidatus Woesearchaeota archaeon]|nr:hypothetical protein [Candidatus Woesearchaeota archaeon]